MMRGAAGGVFGGGVRSIRTPLLPPAVAGWPSTLLLGGATPPPPDGDLGGSTPEAVAACLARIREERLFWPVPRSGARRARAVALDDAGLAQAQARFPDASIARTRDLATVDPDGVEAVFGGADSALLWAALGGLASPGPDPNALLAAARGVCPWGRGALTLAEAVAAQALLRAAAARARGPVGLFGMSRWKRRGLAPFLTGPDGPPVALRCAAAARAHPGPVAVWGVAPAPAAETGTGATAASAGRALLRVEDGFLRSVGLGLRHVPPLSLAIASGPPHFDATRRNAFEETVARARFDPALLARAAQLRERIATLRLTKYNLGGAGALPAAEGREAVLVPGQVEDDASIRLGARNVRRNVDLLAAARARFPDALIVYKPHPDVLTGLRPGAVPDATARRFADRVAADASAADCLDWADRVVTITSLTGFEALLRGKRVTCLGRPFYAGWGLTDDADPPPRDRSLTLDELTAAALLLHASYVDPRTGLPAPAEVAIEALVRQRAAAGRPGARLTRAWRDAASWALNLIGRAAPSAVEAVGGGFVEKPQDPP